MKIIEFLFYIFGLVFIVTLGLARVYPPETAKLFDIIGNNKLIFGLIVIFIILMVFSSLQLYKASKNKVVWFRNRQIHKDQYEELTIGNPRAWWNKKLFSSNPDFYIASVTYVICLIFSIFVIYIFIRLILVL